MGQLFLLEISKVPYAISHKILNPYIAKYAFYWLSFLCVIYDIFELWRHKPQWCVCVWWGVAIPNSYSSHTLIYLQIRYEFTVKKNETQILSKSHRFIIKWV